MDAFPFSLAAMRSVFIIPILLMACARLWAGPSPEQARRQYVVIKDDGSLFVGEGSAWLKDEGESLERAQGVAVARARGSLAEAIEVRVQSRVEVSEESGPDGAKESAKAKAVSSSDLTIHLVKTQIWEDFPKKGQVTALAWISKEEWRRQKKGKEVAVYRPENGLRLYTQLYFPKFIRNDKTKGVNENKGWGLGLVWRHLFAAFSSSVASFDMNPQQDSNRPGELISEMVELGYEITPWEWRVQPYLPLGLAYGNHEINAGGPPEHASTYGGFLGGGLRYWPNDSLAIELQGRYFVPLGAAPDVKLAYSSGGQQRSLQLTPDLSGLDIRAQVLWSAF